MDLDRHIRRLEIVCVLLALVLGVMSLWPDKPLCAEPDTSFADVATQVVEAQEGIGEAFKVITDDWESAIAGGCSCVGIPEEGE